ncbi:MAG: heavy metal-associated protein [Candidatus Berkelbacteria bacterium]|nr:heavy metal-associated protein [Candidatus Berkelbacteria bacterium]
MHRTIVPIKGMHCRSCEILIENNLRRIPGFSNTNVSYKKSEAEIYSTHPLSQELINKAISEAGYEIGSDQKAWISRNPAEYKDIAIAFLVLAILYFAAKNLGIFNFSFATSSKPSSLAVVLVVGLTAGISTCMALVGGLVLGMAARHSEKHPEATPLQKFRPHLYFNIGRIFAFFLLGGLVGLIGKAFQLSSPALGTLMIFVGLVMFALGIQLTELFPRISSAGFTLPSGLSKLFGIKKHHEKEYSHRNSFLVGTLTFFLPCGFTQAMQLYAMSSGSFLSGGLIMATFALGTAPGLLGIGGLTSIVKGAFAKRFFKFAGLLVIALAMLNISNGYNLTGWRGISFKNKSVAEAKTDPNVKLENGTQVVRMTQQSRGYSPNKFTIVKDIPVKWIIDSKDPGSCASSIVASDIGVRKFLNAGENIVEFTPTKLGDIKFSCSMGMYTGRFTVVENKQIEGSVGDNIQSSPSQAPATATPTPNKDTQLIKARFVATDENSTTDINPNEFTLTAGKPVRFEIYAEVDGQGCMGSITIPKLVNSPQFLEKGKTVVFEFTPEKGTYYITCAMGAIRGKITVN